MLNLYNRYKSVRFISGILITLLGYYIAGGEMVRGPAMGLVIMFGYAVGISLVVLTGERRARR